MNNAKKFKEMMHAGEVPLGVTVTFTDSTVTEALCNVCDFVWIDMEHNGYTLETVQAHIMATKGSDTTALNRIECAHRMFQRLLRKEFLDFTAHLEGSAEHGVLAEALPARLAYLSLLRGAEARLCKVVHHVMLDYPHVDHLGAAGHWLVYWKTY